MNQVEQLIKELNLERRDMSLVRRLRRLALAPKQPVPATEEVVVEEVPQAPVAAKRTKK